MSLCSSSWSRLCWRLGKDHLGRRGWTGREQSLWIFSTCGSGCWRICNLYSGHFSVTFHPGAMTNTWNLNDLLIQLPSLCQPSSSSLPRLENAILIPTELFHFTDPILQLNWNEYSLLPQIFTFPCLPCQHASANTIPSSQDAYPLPTLSLDCHKARFHSSFQIQRNVKSSTPPFLISQLWLNSDFSTEEFSLFPFPSTHLTPPSVPAIFI